tara:strand:- start:31 stop:780 length:750 start_codon:yes stop_codon:yes gene_type:complete
MTYLDNLFSLSGKLALVTGGASGNGRAIAKAFHDSGARVLVVDKLIEQKKDIYYDYYEVCDLSNNSDICRLYNLVQEKYGDVDVLVNNAGISMEYNDLKDTKYWETTMSVNLHAPFELIRLFSTGMIRKGGGSIINITSLNSEMAFPNNPSYVASKGGLKQLTKSFAYDLGRYNIRCNNIGPGYIRTKMTNGSWNDPEKRSARAARTILGRWGETKDLVGAAIFLASDASSYITGQDIYVDGGWLVKGL